MKASSSQKWAETRAKGKWRFVLKYGSFWGAVMTLFIVLINPYFKILTEPIQVKDVAILFLVYWFIGIGIYMLIWRQNEKAFLHFTNQDD